MTDEKTGYKILSYLAAVVVGACFLFCGFGEKRSLNQLQNDTNSTMGNLKANTAIVGVQVERFERTTDRVGKLLDGASTDIERSRNSAEKLKTGIDELKRTVGECQRLARENSKIIEGIDREVQ